MASLALAAVGTALGAASGAAGLTILGSTLSAATIGGMIGSAVGSVVDSMILASMQPDQHIEGARLDTLQVTTSTEGAVIPRVYGRMKLGGNIIWATDFREVVNTQSQGGGKGGGPSVTTTSYQYYASFAVAFCEGPIAGFGRIWADGELMDLRSVTYRTYLGDEDQLPDTFMAAKSGADKTPAYRGTAYIMFEDLFLESYGNRIPQITVEVLNSVGSDESVENVLQSVAMIPGTGEYSLATQKVTKKGASNATTGENLNVSSWRTDFNLALDQLQASAPNVESVSLVVSWFGDDLRCGNCNLRPGVESRNKDVSIEWHVDDTTRATAYLVSRDADGRPSYGGTPSDHSVVQAIKEIKSRGMKVFFYPFILMDVEEDNLLPDPYSDNGSSVGQAPFPWRGRITCHPSIGYTGSVDGTSDAASQVQSFFGSAGVDDFRLVSDILNEFTIQEAIDAGFDNFFDYLLAYFDVFDGLVTTRPLIRYVGPNEWSYRRFIIHSAMLCAAAGGVDTFLIGSEMVALNRVRDQKGDFPAVDHMTQILADVREVLGAGVDISYAADWSEYFGYHAQDGSGDVYFHLDPIWANPNCDFVGIDNYMPLSDWRDGDDHLDAAISPSVYDHAYLQGNIEGGEGFDWYYASAADRESQTRTPITDGAEGKPWVFRYKDLRSWWSNQHYNRPGGVESGSPTAWVPQSKPFRFTEYGCPAIDRGTNQPNVFYDPKSSESAVPYHSRGWRDDDIQRAYIEALLPYWQDAANNPTSGVYAGPMVDVANSSAWAWDARPYPHFPSLESVWSDGENWRLGHWLTGRIGSQSLPALVSALCERAGMPTDQIDVSSLRGSVEGFAISALESARASISICATHFGFDATESLGKIKFQMRGQNPVATIELDDMLPGDGDEPFILDRAQETELPQALKWSVLRSDADYEQATTEARRTVVQSSRISSESFPIAVPPEMAAKRVARSLMERWAGREMATFGLPPSRMALDPTDVVRVMHDGRGYDIRLQAIADNDARDMSGILQDRLAYDLPPGAARASSLKQATVFGGGDLQFMDLPHLRADYEAHQPLFAAYARPWPGALAIYRSPGEDGFTLQTSIPAPAMMATTVSDFDAGPTSRFDMANELVIDITSGNLVSVDDLAVFEGGNTFAIETSEGVWEIVSAAEVELVATSRYRLTRLLRGLRGTEGAMVASLAAGARVVKLDDSVTNLPITSAEVGLPYNWLVGPASLPIDDDAYVQEAFTAQAVGLRPFSPCHVKQPNRTGRTPGDLTIDWIRRSRDLSADSWAAAEIPIGESSEAYEVDIMDGATVLRTLSASTPSVVYTGAQQTADFGALLGPGDTLDVRIAQVSLSYGRGAILEQTLNF